MLNIKYLLMPSAADLCVLYRLRPNLKYWTEGIPLGLQKRFLISSRQVGSAHPEGNNAHCDTITIYNPDVKQLYIPRKFEIFCEHDRKEGSLRFEPLPTDVKLLFIIPVRSFIS